MELVLIFCCIRNYFRARAAKFNAALWTFYTFLSILVAWLIGSFITVIIMVIRDPQIRALLSQQPPDRQRLMEYVKHQNLFVHEMFLMFCGLGGYLFIRHLMIRKEEMAFDDLDFDDDLDLDDDDITNTKKRS